MEIRVLKREMIVIVMNVSAPRNHLKKKNKYVTYIKKINILIVDFILFQSDYTVLAHSTTVCSITLFLRYHSIETKVQSLLK